MDALGAFDKLRQFVAQSDSTIALPTDAFIVIDRKASIQRLGLDEKGVTNGAANYPSADTENLDGVESEIVAEMAEHAASDVTP